MRPVLLSFEAVTSCIKACNSSLPYIAPVIHPTIGFYSYHLQSLLLRPIPNLLCETRCPRFILVASPFPPDSTYPASKRPAWFSEAELAGVLRSFPLMCLYFDTYVNCSRLLQLALWLSFPSTSHVAFLSNRTATFFFFPGRGELI